MKDMTEDRLMQRETIKLKYDPNSASFICKLQFVSKQEWLHLRHEVKPDKQLSKNTKNLQRTLST